MFTCLSRSEAPTAIRSWAEIDARARAAAAVQRIAAIQMLEDIDGGTQPDQPCGDRMPRAVSRGDRKR